MCYCLVYPSNIHYDQLLDLSKSTHLYFHDIFTVEFQLTNALSSYNAFSVWTALEMVITCFFLLSGFEREQYDSRSARYFHYRPNILSEKGAITLFWMNKKEKQVKLRLTTTSRAKNYLVKLGGWGSWGGWGGWGG